MTANLSCELLRDDILDLLYEDGDLAERSRARDHLALCVLCRAEYGELKAVRKMLGGWSLPENAPLQSKRSPSFFSAPAALAAAAGLVLGIGVAMIARSSFLAPFGPPNATMAPPSVARSALSPQFVSYDDLQLALQAQESRHQEEITDLRRSLSLVSESPGFSRYPNGSPASNPPAARIESLLRASEERQSRMIDARLAGLRTETDLQRQYDMAQIAAGLAYLDSRTGADAARTSELMKNLVRVTAKPPDR